MKTTHLMIAPLILLVGLLSAPETAPCFARFVPERDDDFAWENDKVAFRAYGPALRGKGVKSGIDCWLKRVDYPVIDKWYAGNLKGKSYHMDHGEGYDPYHVGASCGCGGLGLWVDGELIVSETFSEWKLIEKRNDRVTFVLNYEWQHAGDRYTEEKQISLRAGERLFRVQSTFRKNTRVAAGLPVAVGLTTHDGKARAMVDAKQGWMACWEAIDTFGLGTGVFMPPERIKAYKLVESKKTDCGHAVFITESDAGGKVEYAAGYGWEKAGEIKTADEWTSYLKQWKN